MKYQNILYATIIANIITIATFIYYKYYNAITDDMSDILPFLIMFIATTIIIVVSSNKYASKSENDPKKIINKYGHRIITILVISFATLFTSIFAFIIITLLMAPKTHTQEQTILARLINCEDYRGCPNKHCKACKKPPIMFYFNEEQISKAIDKYNREHTP